MSKTLGFRQASREMAFEQNIEKQVGIYYVEEYGPRFSRQRGMVEDWGWLVGGRKEESERHRPDPQLCWGI